MVEKEKKEQKWSVQLAIVDETRPPERVITDGEETLDIYSAIARVLNNQEEKLMKLLD